MMPGGIIDVWSGAGHRAPDPRQYMSDPNFRPIKQNNETIDINLSANGKQLGTVTADPLNARKIKQGLYSMQQNGGY